MALFYLHEWIYHQTWGSSHDFTNVGDFTRKLGLSNNGASPQMDDHQIMGKKQTSEAPQGFRQTQRYRAQCRTGIGGGRLAHIPVLSLEEFTKPISSTGLCFNGLSLLAFLTAPGGLWVFDLSSGSRLQHSVENQ